MATQILSGRERFIAPDPVATANPSFSENLLTLCASAIFAGLSPRELMEILSCARMRTFARDEVLYSQGQTARGLIVLQSGSVKHTQLSSNGDEVLLRMSGNGEAVNLQTGPTGCNHTCSARAMEHCRAWVWEYNRLQELLERYPRLRANITQVLSSRLQELEERFREIATEKVARRLALVLLRLMKQLGKKTSCRGGPIRVWSPLGAKPLSSSMQTGWEASARRCFSLPSPEFHQQRGATAPTGSDDDRRHHDRSLVLLTTLPPQVHPVLLFQHARGARQRQL
jgi:CRP-like cAMP-binding protein